MKRTVGFFVAAVCVLAVAGNASAQSFVTDQFIMDPSLSFENQETTQFIYMEHLTLVLATITYWGTGEQLEL